MDSLCGLSNNFLRLAEFVYISAILGNSPRVGASGASVAFLRVS